MRPAELRKLPDDDLLAQMRAMPRHSQERAGICEILIERYASLIQSCVRPYRWSPEPTEDLMQVGYIGLLKAINNFNPELGDSLAAYAAPCVSGEIKRHFRDKRWQVRVRRPVQELVLEMRTATGDLLQQLGHTPSDGELATRLGVTEEDIREARQADLVFSSYSLYAPLSGGEDPGQLAGLLGEDDPAVEHATDMEAVNTHLDELPEREQRILVLRFYGNLTQDQIGQRLGISQMHVSRLLTKALDHLRGKLTEEPTEQDDSVALTARLDVIQRHRERQHEQAGLERAAAQTLLPQDGQGEEQTGECREVQQGERLTHGEGAMP